MRRTAFIQSLFTAIHSLGRSPDPPLIVLTLAVRLRLVLQRLFQQILQVAARPVADAQRGSGTVEVVGWIAIACAVLGIVGAIVRQKLTTMANSLPDTLNW